MHGMVSRAPRSSLMAVVAVAVLGLAGCGSSSSDGGTATKPTTSPSRTAADPVTTISEDGVYEAGVDILAGVWTTSSSSDDPCVGATATTADYDAAGEGSAQEGSAGELITTATSSGSGLRIEVNDGEFFTSSSCNEWTLEDKDDGSQATADPATLEGGCEILLGDDGALDAALAFPDNDDDAERTRVQDRLFSIVAAENDTLGDAAGQLVDYLDDPAAYLEDGELSSTITDAVADIRETCDVL